MIEPSRSSAGSIPPSCDVRLDGRSKFDNSFYQRLNPRIAGLASRPNGYADAAYVMFISTRMPDDTGIAPRHDQHHHRRPGRYFSLLKPHHEPALRHPDEPRE